MTPLRLLILSDGRPGHFNLSEGIAAAIARRGAVEVQRIEVRRGGWPGAIVAGLASARFSASTMLQSIHGVDARALAPVDIVVSAGAETLAANIWCARALNAQNVFYGSLRLFRPQDFSLVLTSYARNANRPRHALTLKPSAFDIDRLASGAVTRSKPPRWIAALIGGPAGPIRFTDKDWSGLLDFMVAMTDRQGVRWLVSNSRRTPIDISDRLAGLAAIEGGPIARYIDVRSPAARPLLDLFETADAVVCTADSSSMISEAIWARLPVLAVSPDVCPLTADEAAYRQWLSAQGWTAAHPISALEPVAVLHQLETLTPLRSHPGVDLAELLASRLKLMRERTA